LYLTFVFQGWHDAPAHIFREQTQGPAMLPAD
jgi:hypothetical protein